MAAGLTERYKPYICHFKVISGFGTGDKFKKKKIGEKKVKSSQWMKIIAFGGKYVVNALAST